jgi:hypothetical protein
VEEYSSVEIDDVVVTVRSPSASTILNDVVQMAFLPGVNSPDANTVWRSARWDTNATIPTALCRIGPGYVQLAQGIYKVWVKITDSPNAPVKSAGIIKVV